jgi:hypothetical protein
VHELANSDEEYHAPSKEGVYTMSFNHRSGQIQNVTHVLASVSHLVFEEA